MKEKKARVEDALHATRAAVEEGIVPGGGVALLRAQPSLDGLAEGLGPDQRPGVAIVRRAIEEPLRQISENAGVEGSIVVDRVTNGKGAFGFNAATETYEDLIQAGVIDPTKGRALGATERGERRGPAPHHGGHDRGEARAEARRQCHARHGRHGDVGQKAPNPSGLPAR
jgi:hypothetical protein